MALIQVGRSDRWVARDLSICKNTVRAIAVTVRSARSGAVQALLVTLRMQRNAMEG